MSDNPELEIPMDEPKLDQENVGGKKRKLLTPVRIVASAEESALVEYYTRQGELRRVYIPMAKIDEDYQAEIAVLEAGVEYGDDFSSVLEPKLITLFHDAGIWTRDDLIRQRQIMTDILVSYYVAPVIQKLTDFYGGK